MNYFFTFIFFVEICMKLLAMRVTDFVSDKMLLLDSFIVILSVAELVMEAGSGADVVSTLRVLRLMRSIRLLKLFKVLKTEDLIVLGAAIRITVASLGNFVILLFLYAYIVSILGMQLFAGKLKYNEEGNVDPDGDSPTLHFDTLWWAFYTIFTTMVGDNWNTVMYDCSRSVNFYTSSLYFVILIFFGQVIMINLFLAILLGNFDSSRNNLVKQKKVLEVEEYLKIENLISQ